MPCRFGNGGEAEENFLVDKKMPDQILDQALTLNRLTNLFLECTDVVDNTPYIRFFRNFLFEGWHFIAAFHDFVE